MENCGSSTRLDDGMYQTFIYTTPGQQLVKSHILEFSLPDSLNTTVDEGSWEVAVVNACIPTHLITIPEHNINFYLFPGDGASSSAYIWKKTLTIESHAIQTLTDYVDIINHYFNHATVPRMKHDDEDPIPLSDVVHFRQIGPMTLELRLLHPEARQLVIHWSQMIANIIQLGTDTRWSVCKQINCPGDMVRNLDTVVILSNLIRVDYHQEEHRHLPLLAKFTTTTDPKRQHHGKHVYINPGFLHYRPVCSRGRIETVQFEFYTEGGEPISLYPYISLTLHYRKKISSWM